MTPLRPTRRPRAATMPHSCDRRRSRACARGGLVAGGPAEGGAAALALALALVLGARTSAVAPRTGGEGARSRGVLLSVVVCWGFRGAIDFNLLNLISAGFVA